MGNTQVQSGAESVDAGLPARRPAGRLTLSGRSLLVVLAILSVVPAWTFAAYVSRQYALTERQSIEEAGRANARTVASNLNFRLTSMVSAVSSLRLSASLLNGNLDDFYQEARALASTNNATVALVGLDGRQLLNTSEAFGAALPPAPPETKFAEARDSGAVQYSNLHAVGTPPKWFMNVAMPVVVDGQVRQILIFAVDTSVHWGEVLDNIELPPGWAVALLDDRGQISARRPSPELHVGKPVHPSVPPLLGTAESGQGIGQSIENQPVHVFYHRLRQAPWTVLIGVPRAEVDGAVSDSVSPVLITGLVILLITVLAAWLIGRAFAAELADVAHATTALRRGEARSLPSAPSRISELAELRSTLDEAMAERRRYEDQLRRLIGDKDLLMQEVHHRVKNSLQLVRGILSLQARSVVHPEARAALNDAATRILTVADVHQHLYQGLSTAEVNVQQYLADLADDLTKSLLENSPDRRVSVTAPPRIWPSEKIIALGLIVTELATNAIKYGRGAVVITLEIARDESAELVVEDSGTGFDAGFEIGVGGGLGSKLISSLVRPEEGSVSIDRSVEHGRVVVRLTPGWRQGARG